MALFVARKSHTYTSTGDPNHGCSTLLHIALGIDGRKRKLENDCGPSVFCLLFHKNRGLKLLWQQRRGAKCLEWFGSSQRTRRRGTNHRSAPAHLLPEEIDELAHPGHPLQLHLVVLQGLEHLVGAEEDEHFRVPMAHESELLLLPPISDVPQAGLDLELLRRHLDCLHASLYMLVEVEGQGVFQREGRAQDGREGYSWRRPSFTPVRALASEPAEARATARLLQEQ